MSEVDLNSFLGEHWLDAVDFDSTQINQWGNHYEDANVMRIRLDGVCYTVTEDPSDGYRSSLGEIFRSDGKDMVNVFNPQWVYGRWKDQSDVRHDDPNNLSDVIEIIDLWTHKVIIEVGTDHTDEWYPSFVASFHPENMNINKGKQ